MDWCSKVRGSIQSSLLGIDCETVAGVEVENEKRPWDRAEPCERRTSENHGKDKVMGQTEVKMEKKGMPLEDAQYQLKISRDTEVINPPPTVVDIGVKICTRVPVNSRLPWILQETCSGFCDAWCWTKSGYLFICILATSSLSHLYHHWYKI